MPEEKLNQLLEQLKQELAKTRALDDTGRKLLHSLEADIRNLLAPSEKLRAEAPVLNRWRNTIEHFEETHPNLTSALSHLLNFLNNAGI